MALFEEGQARLGVDRTVIHPLWIPGGEVGPHDIALLRTATAIAFSATIQPIRLPAADVIPTGSATVAGWGQTGGTIVAQMPDILQKTVLPLISMETCRAAAANAGITRDPLDDTNVCTGPLTGGTAVCSGDSGSPLIQGDVAIGLVSWGWSPCGSVGVPTGVFKRNSAYIDWININAVV